MSELDRHLQDWHPGPVTGVDPLDPEAATALAAVLDATTRTSNSGRTLPALWHWVYFLHWPSHSALGADGHVAEGRFLPPIPDRRRMFAGGRLTVHAPLRLGMEAVRTSTLANTAVKQGRSGAMAFVTVRSEFRQAGALKLVEEQDFVYRSGETKPVASPPAGRSPQSPQSSSQWCETFRADPVLLFRFSAVTANAHRIHYDQHYACNVEHYPALVVHGPLLVLLMTELSRRMRPGHQIASLDYRLRKPVFADDHVLITGDRDSTRSASLSILGGASSVMADANVTFAEGSPNEP